jgi:glycosyltransferase involved in cell wall biosynthesis
MVDQAMNSEATIVGCRGYSTSVECDGHYTNAVRTTETKSMKLSVAMATYNGEQFLAEQLQSFVDQSLPPDELVVCDDHSSDRTMEIIREFQGQVSFKVVAVRNENRLGVVENFAKAVDLCTGDIIFLSDQDDVWAIDKLQRHTEIYLQHDDVGLVFNNASLVDAHLKSLGVTSFQKLGLDEYRLAEFGTERAFELLVKGRPLVYGSALSFRSGLWQYVRPIPECFYHDNWLALIASMVSRIRPMHETLNLYRQHSAQIQGLIEIETGRTERHIPTRQEWMEVQAIQATLALERMKKLDQAGIDLTYKDYQQYLHGFLGHLWRRTSLPKSLIKRLPTCFMELVLGNYFRYSDSVRSTLSLDIRPKFFK